MQGPPVIPDHHSQVWSQQHIIVLKTMLEKAAGYRWLHDKSYRHYKTLNNRCTYTTIVLSTFTGIGGFSAHASGTTTSFIIAGINIFCGLLNSIQKFVRSAEKSEAHNTASRQYASFVQSITLELNQPEVDRERPTTFLRQCKGEYERLSSTAPDIPNKMVRLYKAEFGSKVKNKPDICNGLSNLNFDKVDGLHRGPIINALTFQKLRVFYKWKYASTRDPPGKPQLRTYALNEENML